ncbi:hypothetical protein NMY22_g202 [Coprinellus aureogranulatus]|nr:hypothetical protein NMY22_g202 [Coprinellus aureogranulatus]
MDKHLHLVPSMDAVSAYKPTRGCPNQTLTARASLERFAFGMHVPPSTYPTGRLSGRKRMGSGFRARHKERDSVRSLHGAWMEVLWSQYGRRDTLLSAPLSAPQARNALD